MLDRALSTLDTAWHARLQPVLETPALRQLREFLEREQETNKEIYPAQDHIFEAFRLTPFEGVKTVILGQDPYHGPGQAHGLSFSVRPGVAVPPSLRNIFKEREADLGLPPPGHGCLEAWAREGVLLLNTVLTVTRGCAGSHAGRGWEDLTDAVIRYLSAEREGISFVLWGRHAQKKKPLIDGKRHLVLESPHPSPFSARRGFFGSQPFSKINDYLTAQGRTPLTWEVAQAASRGLRADAGPLTL